MAPRRVRRRTCFLCKTNTGTLHRLVKSVELRKKWLHFLFGRIPLRFANSIDLCSAHFRDEDFVNLGEYNGGFVSKLYLKPGAVPSRMLPNSPPASVQSPTGSWTDASSANEASKSPSVDAFPVISCVYSMADLTPSRKRKLSDEPRRTPTTPRRNSSVAPPPVDAGPTRDDTSETDDVYEVSSSSPVRKIKNERDEEIANETSDGTVPTAEQGTQFSGRVIKEESDSQILRILNIGEPLYIDSDDDTAKDVKREEPVANNRAFSLNSLHRSSQTEETWPDKDYKSLYEKATDKIQQLVGSRADLLEGAQNKEGQEESGDITWQVDALVRELDKMTDERNRLRFQLKNAEIEKASLSRQCEELRARVRQEEREKDSPLQNGNSSAASDPDHLSRLIELRYNIGRLLVNEVPYLDLAQVNYECEVIDEILDQYLARNGADGTDAACSK